jgi:hypothetical protein
MARYALLSFSLSIVILNRTFNDTLIVNKIFSYFTRKTLIVIFGNTSKTVLAAKTALIYF